MRRKASALRKILLRVRGPLILDAYVIPNIRFSGALGSGLALFSRYRIVETSVHPYSLNGAPIDVAAGDWFVGKAAASIVIEHPVLDLVQIFNTHVISKFHPHQLINRPHFGSPAFRQRRGRRSRIFESTPARQRLGVRKTGSSSRRTRALCDRSASPHNLISPVSHLPPLAQGWRFQQHPDNHSHDHHSRLRWPGRLLGHRTPSRIILVLLFLILKRTSSTHRHTKIRHYCRLAAQHLLRRKTTRSARPPTFWKTTRLHLLPSTHHI